LAQKQSASIILIINATLLLRHIHVVASEDEILFHYNPLFLESKSLVKDVNYHTLMSGFIEFFILSSLA